MNMHSSSSPMDSPAPSVVFPTPSSFHHSSFSSPLHNRMHVAPSPVLPHAARSPAVYRFKTELCRNWEAKGVCVHRGCTFAHGRGELRPSPSSATPDGRGRAMRSPESPARDRRVLCSPVSISEGEDHPPMPAEHLMDLVMAELKKERATVTTLHTANRELEHTLRVAQAKRQHDVRHANVLDDVAAALEQEVAIRVQLIGDVRQAHGTVDFEAAVEKMMVDFDQGVT